MISGLRSEFGCGLLWEGMAVFIVVVIYMC